MISLGFIFGLVATVVFTALGVAGIGGGKVVRSRDLTDDPGFVGRGLSIVGWVVTVLTVAIAAWGFFPYDMQYHSYRHVEGTVASVQGRLLGDGKATTQNYAVRLRDDGQTYRCDDTRCSLLHEGDRVALWCIREWQYAATPGWVCNFDSTTAAAR